MVNTCKCRSAGYTNLSDKVSILPSSSFHEFLGTLPETFVLLDLPDLQLRNEGGFLLLLSVILIESQRVVWLFLLTVFGTAVRPLGRLFGIRGGGRGGGGPVVITSFSTPVIITTAAVAAAAATASSTPVSITSFSTPVIATSSSGIRVFGGGSLFSSGIVGSSSLSCEFCLAFITTPRLVDLLVRVAKRGLG